MRKEIERLRAVVAAVEAVCARYEASGPSQAGEYRVAAKEIRTAIDKATA